MNLMQEFDKRIAAIHGLDRSTGRSLNINESAMDIRHAEFQAMADVFLGEEFDVLKLGQIEGLQIALQNVQGDLYRRYEKHELTGEEYVDSFNNLLTLTFAAYEQILGQEDFVKLFGAPPSELAGFIDREEFLSYNQLEGKPKVAGALQSDKRTRERESQVTGHAQGSFCWVELGTNDTAAAKEFYTGLFGWDAIDIHVGPNAVSTIFQIRGLDVASMYTLWPEQQSQGFGPQWMSYVAVLSARSAAEKAKLLRGNVLVDAFDAMDLGRSAVIQDPLGAIFCVWERKAHFGFKLSGEVWTFCWNELWTTDREAAAKFYSELFGWKTKPRDHTGGPLYTEWINADQQIGGMIEVGSDVAPPKWLPYFMVEDCDTTAEKAKVSGGQLYVPPTDIPNTPNTGRFSVVQDVQGAMFGIVSLTSRAG